LSREIRKKSSNQRADFQLSEGKFLESAPQLAEGPAFPAFVVRRRTGRRDVLCLNNEALTPRDCARACARFRAQHRTPRRARHLQVTEK
jgi:hypothetical protein